MFTSPSQRRGHDRGSGLLEVVVALGVLALVAVTVIPMTVAGLRAAGTARDITQAKGVAQARLELIRNMPFFVGRAAGDYIDVLDTYYRDLTAPAQAATCKTGDTYVYPPTSWSGYVPATAARCDYEPVGPFYRKVVNPVQAPGLGAFSMVIDTQFLSAHAVPQPVTPPSIYDSQVAGRDVPAAMQLGVTVTVFYQTTSGPRWASTFTQVERTTPISPLIVAEGEASAVRVSSMVDSGPPGGCLDADPNSGCVHLASEIGVVNLAGELFTGSRVTAYATAGVAGSSLGNQIQAAAANAVAPPDTAVLADVRGPVTLGSDCNSDSACFGTSTVDGVHAAASDGLPRAGAPTSPVRALIPHGTGYDGFRFHNRPSGDRLGLLPAAPLVSLDTSATGNLPGVADCQFGGAAPATAAHLATTGYLDATKDTASPRVDACVTTQTAPVVLFPTSFAPNGVVRVTIHHAAAQCAVTTTSGTPTFTTRATYSGTVSYWNGTGYTDVPFTDATAADALAAVNLNTRVGAVNGTDRYLGDYIASWRALPGPAVIRSTAKDTARVDIQGLVTIGTQPTRYDVPGGQGADLRDPTSVVSLQVGSLSCQAGDFR